jgi:methylase of polypeptide subunit release factors
LITKKLIPPVQQEARTILYVSSKPLPRQVLPVPRPMRVVFLAWPLGRDDAFLPHEDIAPMDQACDDRLAAMVARRLEGEPISRIRGWREFWSLRFAVSPATLDPRPDSETLIDAAVNGHHATRSRIGLCVCLILAREAAACFWRYYLNCRRHMGWH